MNPIDFDREVMYRASLSIIRVLSEKGLISDKEFMLLNRQLVEEYRPIIGSL